MQHHANFAEDALRTQKGLPQELFEIALPEKMKNVIDLKSLIMEEDSYVDEALRAHYSDIMFTVKRKIADENSRLYMLCEHKSSPEHDTLEQLRSYLTVIHAGLKTPQPVISIVLYHGREEWRVKRTYLEQYNLTAEEREAYGEIVLNFGYVLIDVNDLDITGLRASLITRTFLLALRDIWLFDSERKLTEFIRACRDVFFEKDNVLFVKKLLTYIYRVHNIRPERMREIISAHVAEEQGDTAMTIVEEMEFKAEKRGKLDDARKMKEKGCDLNFIIEITGLTKEELAEGGVKE